MGTDRRYWRCPCRSAGSVSYRCIQQSLFEHQEAHPNQAESAEGKSNLQMADICVRLAATFVETSNIGHQN
eukprot:973318-Amphidinium_carterae.1